MPDIIKIVNKKPWELSFLDIKELWKFGTFGDGVKFDEILCGLGLPLIKFKSDKSDIEKIEYKIKKIIDIFLKLGGFYEK